MRYASTVLTAVLFAGAVFAEDTNSRALLIGEWQNVNDADQSSTWIIEQKGEAIRIVASKGDQKLIESECKPVGVDCEAKDSGKAAKISMYYNGPALVQLETKGSEVTKRRFTAKDQESVDLEIFRLIPSGNTETLHLKRVRK